MTALRHLTALVLCSALLELPAAAALRDSSRLSTDQGARQALALAERHLGIGVGVEAPAAQALTTPPLPSERPRASSPLQQRLDAALTVHLLAQLTDQGRITWSAVQRRQLHSALAPLAGEGASALTPDFWAALPQRLEQVLSPAQRRNLEAAWAAAQARAERLLSVSRLALLDGPGPASATWRLALAVPRGPALLQRWEQEPEFNPYRSEPYRSQLRSLLGH